MPVTLRYADGSGAVHRSAEDALAQARHDLSFPTHLDPHEIVDGDVSDLLDGHRATGATGPRALPERARVLERRFDPCACHLCEFQREAPTLHHEDRAVFDELLAARVILERDLTADERGELERLLGSSARVAQRLRDARAGGTPPIAGGSVPAAGFTITWTAVGLTAATAKTVAGVISSANTPVDFAEVAVGGDGASGNLLVEMVYGTNAGAGTSTPFTPLQFRGRAQTIAAAGSITYSAEPTVLTVIKRWRFPWPGGPFVLQSPLGRELNSITAAATSGKFAGVRCTSSATVTNSDGYAEIEE